MGDHKYMTQFLVDEKEDDEDHIACTLLECCRAIRRAPEEELAIMLLNYWTVIGAPTKNPTYSNNYDRFLRHYYVKQLAKRRCI